VFTPCCQHGVWYISIIIYGVISRNLHICQYYNFFHGLLVGPGLQYVNESLVGLNCFLVGKHCHIVISGGKQR
jgi:hypothetical protein